MSRIPPAPLKKGMDDQERRQVARMLLDARANGAENREEAYDYALGEATNDSDLEAMYFYLVELDREDVVDVDHGMYEDLVRLGCIEEDNDCGSCRGTGIGQHGDPDTSRCGSCGGRGYFK